LSFSRVSPPPEEPDFVVAQAVASKNAAQAMV
jgi:hypothetical protein